MRNKGAIMDWDKSQNYARERGAQGTDPYRIVSLLSTEWDDSWYFFISLAISLKALEDGGPGEAVAPAACPERAAPRWSGSCAAPRTLLVQPCAPLPGELGESQLVEGERGEQGREREVASGPQSQD